MSPQVTMVSVDKLRPNPRNARTHSKKQVRQIANSIQRFGWTTSIVVDESGTILAGHGRFQAARLLGLKEVPVITVSHLNDAQKRALVLADNKIAENAGWDRAILAAELGELSAILPAIDHSLAITGFEPAEIDSLMGDLVDREDDPADEIPALADNAVSRRGDLWTLAPHRLLCGDATNAADVETLMGGALAAMAFTDPPYNVRVASIQGRGANKHREFVAGSGEMSEAEYVAFLTTALGHAAAHSKPGSLHYVCIDWRNAALREALLSMNALLHEGRETHAGQRRRGYTRVGDLRTAPWIPRRTRGLGCERCGDRCRCDIRVRNRWRIPH